MPHYTIHRLPNGTSEVVIDGAEEAVLTFRTDQDLKEFREAMGAVPLVGPVGSKDADTPKDL